MALGQPQFESYQMGLQISRCVYSEEAQESDLWGDSEIPGEDAARVSGAERMPDRGRASDVGSHPHVHQHPTEVLGLERGGLRQREERNRDCAALSGQESQLQW